MTDIYKPPEADLAHDAPDREVAYAGFWIRVVASILDSIWLILLTLALGWMVYGAYYFESAERALGWSDFFISYVLPVILTVMPPLFAISVTD